ncbi:hypothetical protein F5Y03DRAFT_225573 [Xylaria venustula]|nr:hypothetical protein F5Y03DRAFT_225573 [Xylaria venustula]
MNYHRMVWLSCAPVLLSKRPITTAGEVHRPSSSNHRRPGTLLSVLPFWGLFLIACCFTQYDGDTRFGLEVLARCDFWSVSGRFGSIFFLSFFSLFLFVSCWSHIPQ